MKCSIQFLLLVGFLALANITVAQKRTQFTSRLAKASFQNKECQCPDGSIVVNKSTLKHIDLAEAPIKSGEVYCLKNMDLKMDELVVKGGKFIVMPGSNLVVNNTITLQAGKIEVRNGASITTEKIRTMSSTIVLKSNAVLKSDVLFDYDGQIMMAESSSIEVNNKMHVHASRGIVYDGDYSNKAKVFVFGAMTGQAMDMMEADNYVEWDYSPATASLND